MLSKAILLILFPLSLFSDEKITRAEPERETKPIKKIAIDSKYLQLGCCWDANRFPPGEERVWNSSPWLRIGFPFWFNQRELGYDTDMVNGVIISPLLDFSQGVNGFAFAPVFFGLVCQGFVLAPVASFPAMLNGMSISLINVCFDGSSSQLGILNWRGAWGRY